MKEADDGRLVTYYQSGHIWEQEVVNKAKRSQAFAWLVTALFGAIALVSLVTLALLVPLKGFEPYLVVVDRNTGYVEVKSGLTRPTNLTEQQAVTQANIVRYIRAREQPGAPGRHKHPRHHPDRLGDLSQCQHRDRPVQHGGGIRHPGGSPALDRGGALSLYRHTCHQRLAL